MASQLSEVENVARQLAEVPTQKEVCGGGVVVVVVVGGGVVVVVGRWMIEVPAAFSPVAPATTTSK